MTAIRDPENTATRKLSMAEVLAVFMASGQPPLKFTATSTPPDPLVRGLP